MADPVLLTASAPASRGKQRNASPPKKGSGISPYLQASAPAAAGSLGSPQGRGSHISTLKSLGLLHDLQVRIPNNMCFRSRRRPLGQTRSRAAGEAGT